MNRITTAISILGVTAALTGCNTFNAIGDVGGATVGTGVGLAKAGTYATVNTLNTGLGVVTSPVKSFHNHHVIYRHGHAYQLHNGRYVRVN